MRNNIIFGVIIIATAFLLNSCGARKSDSTKKETVIKTDIVVDSSNSEKSIWAKFDESNIQKETTNKMDSQNNIVSSKKTYKPINPEKEATVIDANGNKTILNNAEFTEESTTDKSEKKTDLSDKTDESRKEDLKFQSEQEAIVKAKVSKAQESTEKIKQSEREAYSIWNLLWLLIPIGIVYWLWKKYKNK